MVLLPGLDQFKYLLRHHNLTVCPLWNHLEYMPFSHCLFLETLDIKLMCKYDIIHKTGSTQHITSLSPPTHSQPFNGPLSGTTRVSRYQKSKTNLDFTEARDSEWQWHQLGHMQVCTSLQKDNHASTPPLRFLQAGCPSCRPTNSIKALKGYHHLKG